MFIKADKIVKRHEVGVNTTKIRIIFIKQVQI